MIMGAQAHIEIAFRTMLLFRQLTFNVLLFLQSDMQRHVAFAARVAFDACSECLQLGMLGFANIFRLNQFMLSLGV